VEPLRLGMKVTRQATCYAPRPSAKPNAIATSATSFNPNTNAMHPSVVDSNGVHRPASSLPPHNGNNQPTTIRTWKPAATGNNIFICFCGRELILDLVWFLIFVFGNR
jgi:hypothetical protein